MGVPGSLTAAGMIISPLHLCVVEIIAALRLFLKNEPESRLAPTCLKAMPTHYKRGLPFGG